MATQPTWRSSRVNVLCGEQQTSKQSLFVTPASHGGAGEQLLDYRPVDEDEAGELQETARTGPVQDAHVSSVLP